MSINPYIPLFIGIAFATIYACVFIFGWARTRRNRRIISESMAYSIVSTYAHDQQTKDATKHIKIISLTDNTFVDNEGNPIDISLYHPYIAMGRWDEYPGISEGDLVLMNNSGKIVYAFTHPDLTDYQ